MDEPSASVRPKVGTKDKSVGWYDKNFHGIEPAARTLLEEYSGIPREDVDQEGATYLDIGCCIGQDVRKLVHDGAPGDHLHGAELQGEFIRLGYDFFRDKETLKATLMQADAFDLGGGSPLRGLVGRVDIIHMGQVVHLFSWERQRDLLENCVQLLRAATFGALILGQAVGDVEGGMWPGAQIFIHSVETFNKMWAEISQRTGLKFECKAILDEGLGIAASRPGWDVDTRKRLSFEVERVD